MTSNNLIKAGLGATLAFGLAVAPLALSPAMANDGPASPGPSSASSTSAAASTEAVSTEASTPESSAVVDAKSAEQGSTAKLKSSGTLPAAVTQLAATEEAHVVINEAYLNGGSTGATHQNKFVELYNPSSAAVSLDGWSLQYRSSGGKVSPTGVAALSGSIAPNGYYLIQGASNGGAGLKLTNTDAETAVSFSGSSGTLFLSNQAAKLPADVGTGSLVGTADVVDLLGYGSSNTFETAPSSAASTATSLNRTNFADSNNNSADFSATAPTPTGVNGPSALPEPPAESGTKTIAEIQGEGAKSPLEGTTVTTRGKVTAAYPTGGFNGYFIQTPGTGGDLDMVTHKASDGVFVYSRDTVADVKVGDYVEVTGLVKEFGGDKDTTTTTEIDVPAGGMTQLDEAAAEVKAAVVSVPATTDARETLEGMLVAPQGKFTITDNYSLNTYGEVGLAVGDTVLLQPTAVGEVDSEAHAKQIAENAARSIKLDDGSSTNFLSAANQSLPLPWLSAETPMRLGSTSDFMAPVIFDNRNNSYKFQPLEALTPGNAADVQPIAFGNNRDTAPTAVGGDLKVATFNVQNYFTQTGDMNPSCEFYNDRDGNPIAVKGGCDQRGAANADNLKRQQDKIVAGIHASGADVLSLEEIENSAKFSEDRDAALATLVAALNVATPGVWDYVRSPEKRPSVDIEDVIRTAFIYKVAAAEPVGDSVILDDPAYTGIARQPLAQAFTLAGKADAAKVILIANHFKSKGSAATPDDTDQGQGNSNLARTAQAAALVKFSAGLQASQGTDKVLLMGDFNAYTFEDPMITMTDAGYVDQGAKTGKQSYAYGGLLGSLDHIVATPAADALVTGQDIWNINSAESVAMGYSRYNYNVTNFYDDSLFAASDHDPVVVGLNLGGAAADTKDINLLNINDFHGRIDSNTVKFAGTVEQLRAAYGDANTAFLSAGDNIGASLFASASQGDNPTIDVLNALEMQASAVGNHEFDKGYKDLAGRVTDAASWGYLGANVYKKGTTDPALDEYKIITVDGVKVAIIGAITQETPTLVTPAGIDMLDFGDPVAAVNRVAKEITDGKLADVIVAEYHEGAGAGTPDGSSFEKEAAAAGAFKEIVTKTSASVNAIFTGHTHKQYAWDAPIPGVSADAVLTTRPVLQTGSYGEFVGQVVLQVNADNKVVSYTQGNVARLAPATDDDEASAAMDEDLVATYPRVAEVKTITDAALAAAEEAGSVHVGKISADITTAQTYDAATDSYKRDDRGSESALGNLVGNALLDALQSEQTGGAEIGVVNPGGLRSDLLYKNDGLEDGIVTYAAANAVLPFVNNLWTTSLTGAQVKTLLEQQWQTNADGTIPSRPFLNLGLSSNVDYTYDSSGELGNHITSVVINGAPLDLKRSYRVGTFSFLATGGDNFRVFNEGTNTKDSGLIDRDAWIKYLGEKSETAPIAPDFSRRGVDVVDAPASVTAGQKVTLGLNKLDLTSLGVTKSTQVTVRYEPSGSGGGMGFAVMAAAVLPSELGTFPVADGAATLSFTVPEALNAGRFTITTDGGTYARLPISIPVSDVAEPTPTQTSTPTETSTTPGTSPSATVGNGSGNGASNGSGDLANTGATALPLGLGALVLLGAGAAVAMASRRKAAKH